MYGVEGVNVIETELLDQFGHVQTLDRKTVMEKDRRRLEGTSLRPEVPNESRIEWRTKWKLQPVLC